MKKLFLPCLIALAFVCSSLNAIAQGVAPNSSDAFDQVLDVPVDGGLYMLIAAGVGYGVKKLYNKKK